MRFFKLVARFIVLIYLVPSLAAAGYWVVKPRPGSWRQADWSSAGVLPDPASDRQARIHVMAARTGGLKGAFAVHSWIVVKRAGAEAYDRYDVVGWGTPVRRNAYPADGRWYSNPPEIIASVTGAPAERLIDDVEAAIARYPHSARGDYVIWPGPNSNTFVATILREVPEIGAVLPSNAVGRDFPADGRYVAVNARSGDLHLSLAGYAGLSAGISSGLEINLMGLVAGFDLRRPALKIPAWGRIGL